MGPLRWIWIGVLLLLSLPGRMSVELRFAPGEACCEQTLCCCAVEVPTCCGGAERAPGGPRMRSSCGCGSHGGGHYEWLGKRWHPRLVRVPTLLERAGQGVEWAPRLAWESRESEPEPRPPRSLRA